MRIMQKKIKCLPNYIENNTGCKYKPLSLSYYIQKKWEKMVIILRSTQSIVQE